MLLSLVSAVQVDGDNGRRGAQALVVHLPHASPETTTEVTPSATVTLTHSLGCQCGEARP
jgi:hypothetical protein